MLNELKLFGVRDKKFYTEPEIIELAKRNAQDYKDKRRLFSRISHLFGSQQTATDIKADLVNDLKKYKQKKRDILENAAIYVNIMIKAKFCDLIVSVKTNEYRTYYNELKQEYLELANNFVKQQYSLKIQDMLMSHLQDALLVLSKNGDTKAELKLEELKNLSEILDCYNRFTRKLRKIQKSFDQEALQECKKQYLEFSCFEKTEVMQSMERQIQSLLREIFEQNVSKVKARIAVESAKDHPKISLLIGFFNEYENIAARFEGFGLDFPQALYSRQKSDLERLNNLYYEKPQYYQNQLANVKEELSDLGSWILSEKLSREVNEVLAEMSYSYVEIGNYKKQIIALNKELYKIIIARKKRILQPIKERIIIQKDKSPAENFSVWQELLNELAVLEQRLDLEDISIADITALKQDISQIKIKYAHNICHLADFKNLSISKHLQLYDLSLENLEPKSKTCIDLQEEKKALYEFQHNFFSDTNKAEKSLIYIKEPQNSDDAVHVMEHFDILKNYISLYEKNPYLDYPETHSVYQKIYELYSQISLQITSWLDSIAKRGTLVLVEPGTGTRIAIFTKPQVLIGRASISEALIVDQTVRIPWKRISAEHLFLDFSADYLEDRKSSNGTYINSKGSDADRLTKENMENVKEFNLAKDITFSLFYVKNNFKGFHFRGFSTKHDHSADLVSRDKLLEELKRTWFVYLPENCEIYIRKYDGQPAYQLADENRNYAIKYSGGKFYFSDWEKNIVNHLILYADKNITMKIEKM